MRLSSPFENQSEEEFLNESARGRGEVQGRLSRRSPEELEADRRRLKGIAEKLRAERQAEREADEAKREAEANAARQGGRPYIWVRPNLVGFPLTVETPAGIPGHVYGGVVEFINPPDRRYDYRVRVEVESGLREIKPGRIGVDPTVQRGASVVEVTAIQRAGREPLSARSMQRERVGELMKMAVARLTVVNGVAGTISQSSAGGLLGEETRRRTASDRATDLDIVEEAHREGLQLLESGRAASSFTLHGHIARALERNRSPHSIHQVKKLLGELQNAKRLERVHGRPRRS